MANLIVVCGPQAVGKMTVAESLRDKLKYNMMMNHDSYHIGYAAAQSTEQDLTKVDYVKHTKDGAFAPVLIKNEEEEGTGHNSVIFWKDAYYIIYHGRDYGTAGQDGYVEARTARVRKMDVQDGILKVL